MSRDVEIDLKRLVVDEQNPRLPDDIANQRDAMKRLADYQGTRLMNLARHILEFGLNPAQRFIVIKDEGGGRDYVVLDGNRRLVAMKAVESPNTFNNLPEGRVRALKRLNAGALPAKVPCVLCEDRNEAEPWIRLTHLDQRSGVGQAKWSSSQKAKHEERLGAKPASLQVLDFARETGLLAPEADALIAAGFPMSILIRMLESREARTRLGLDHADGQVSTQFPRDQIAPGIARVINDVAAKVHNSRSLNTAKQWSDYVKAIPAAELPDPATKGPTSVPLAAAPQTSSTAPPAKTPTKRDRPGRSKRTFAIPSDVVLNIPPNRIHEIYRELKGEIRVDEAPNAAGALIRVLLEMSMTAYCAREDCAPKRDDLRDYLAATLGDLKAKGLSNKAANRIQAGIIDSSSGLTTVQAVVHDPDFPVTGVELRAMWDRIQPLFLLMWP